jgi:hypothetical protein
MKTDEEIREEVKKELNVPKDSVWGTDDTFINAINLTIQKTRKEVIEAIKEPLRTILMDAHEAGSRNAGVDLCMIKFNNLFQKLLKEVKQNENR